MINASRSRKTSSIRSIAQNRPDDVPGAVRASLRVSGAGQAKNGFGLDAQRSGIEAYCQARGWPVPVIYEDAGFSGRLDTRPELERLFRELRAGDVVIVHSLSRLSRGGVAKLTGAVQRIKDRGARFISISENVDTHGQAGSIVLALFGALAEIELEQTRDRTMAGRLEAARQGFWPTGSVAYGYVLDDGTIKPDPERADHARLIFQLAPSRSIEKLITELEARGVPAPPRAKRWLSSTVSNMLKNRVYIGQLHWGEKVHPNEPESWIPIPCPPLVSVAEFEAAQRTHTPRPRARPDMWPLTGFLRCRACGGPVCGASVGLLERKRFTYRCAVAMKGQGYKRAGMACSMSRAFDAVTLNALAASALTETLLSPESLALIAAPVTRQSETIMLERVRLEKQRERLLDAYQEGDMTREQLRDRRRHIEARLVELERPIESVEIPSDLRAALSDVRNLRGVDLVEVLRELHARLEVDEAGNVTVSQVHIPVEESL
jgi:site-specific DNA recombinase